MNSTPLYGIVDVGSNTFNLLLAKFNHGQLEILAQDRRPVMLGKGSHEKGFILPEMVSEDSTAFMEVVPTAQTLCLLSFASFTIFTQASLMYNSSESILCFERSSTSICLKFPRPA